MLMLIYPPAIALIDSGLRRQDSSAMTARVYVSAATVGTWAAAIFDFMKTLPGSLQESLHLDALVNFAADQCLPLFDQNLVLAASRPASALSSV